MTETFVIHLERAAARKPNVEILLDASPYPARIWPACDGSAMEADKRKSLYPGTAILEPAYPFPLSVGEIGCFESHRSIWRYMVENNLPVALVLEDDVAINAPVFHAALNLCEAHIAALGYIQLQVRDLKGQHNAVVSNGGVAIMRPAVVPLRTSAQMIDLETARLLLAASETFDRPVDVFLQMFWETGVHLHCVVPSGVSDLTSQVGGTTIQSKRSFGQKLSAEVKRSRYRRRIKRLSRQGLPI